MKRIRWKKQFIISAIVLEAAILVLLIGFRRNTDSRDLLPGTGSSMPLQNTAADAVPAADAEQPESTPQPDLLAGKLLLSELMVKNRAALQHENGQFYDWFEITNASEETIDLAGWNVSDGKTEWELPSGSLKPGEYQLVYAAKDADMPSVAAFSLSAGDTLSLFTPSGSLSDCVVCPDSRADIAYSRTGDTWQESKYPTPGSENTRAGFVECQKLRPAGSTLVLNEVCVANHSNFYLAAADEYPDWIELYNASSSPVSLSDYYISDSSDYLQCRLPSVTLAPGAYEVILCTELDFSAVCPNYSCIPLALDSENEHLYLSSASELMDYVSLRDIPYGGSYGRSRSGELCWFTSTTPGSPNEEGYSYRCAEPVSGGKDGVFENSPVELDLTAEGTIYYTTDGSMPTEASLLYTGPLPLDHTCVIRAIAVDGKGLPSHARTLNYFINEGYTMPVLSIVGDEAGSIEEMYRRAIKGKEVPGNISFYDGSNGFNVDCGIKMAGRATLTTELKKNFSFKFRGEYGTKRLNYDLFGDRITSFSNLTLRAGQDYAKSLIRCELAQDLCIEMTDKVLSQHSRYCIAYLNGEYYGIYALKEKVNEQLCADYNNVSKESIQIVDGPIPQGTPLYNEIIMPCVKDMSVQENYEEYCRHVDIDSVMDWMIIQGFTANSDILYGNIAYYKSTENDGLWRMIFFDLDAAFRVDYYNFRNVFDISYNLNQPAQWLRHLLVNQEFREKFLVRVSELLKTTLTDENVLAKANAMYDLMDTELADNCERWKITDFERQRQTLLGLFGDGKYTAASVNAVKNYLSVYLHIPADEIARYF